MPENICSVKVVFNDLSMFIQNIKIHSKSGTIKKMKMWIFIMLLFITIYKPDYQVKYFTFKEEKHE